MMAAQIPCKLRDLRFAQQKSLNLNFVCFTGYSVVKISSENNYSNMKMHWSLCLDCLQKYSSIPKFLNLTGYSTAKNCRRRTVTELCKTWHTESDNVPRLSASHSRIHLVCDGCSSTLWHAAQHSLPRPLTEHINSRQKQAGSRHQADCLLVGQNIW